MKTLTTSVKGFVPGDHILFSGTGKSLRVWRILSPTTIAVAPTLWERLWWWLKDLAA